MHIQQDYNLDKEEQDLLDSYERGEWKTIKNFAAEKKRYQQAARYTLSKPKNINIRLQVMSLERIKSKAASLGIPYQTLASSILHQYASGQTIPP